jgi:arylsulfatase A-like enzyme
MPRLRWMFVCGAVAAAVVGAWSWRRAAPPPNVLLIVVDSLRADALGTYGSAAGLTPFLDRFAERALVFDRAYAASSWTMPSVASLMTAQYPSQHGVIGLETALTDDRTTLAEVLRGRGYRCAAFSANPIIPARLGFAQGFDEYRVVGSANLFTAKADATAVSGAALEWLSRRPADSPYFLYLHYMEPHVAYRAHPGITAPRATELAADDVTLGLRVMAGLQSAEAPGRPWEFTPGEHQRLRDLYAGEVVYADRQLADLFAALEQRGALGNTIVVITADHGEEFGEHGLFDHGASLFESAIHVPLLVRLPSGDAATGRVVEPVELAGFAPAVLGALDIDVPSSFGIAALPLRADASDAAHVGLSELLELNPQRRRVHDYAYIASDATLLHTPSGAAAVYDVRNDALEQMPLSASPRVEALVDAAQALHARVAAAPPSATVKVELDAADRERLRSLGYLPADQP